MEEGLPKEKHLGKIDNCKLSQQLLDPDSSQSNKLPSLTPPPLSTIININDFENVSQRFLSSRAWAYYASTADNGFVYKENIESWNRVSFRPRILRNVKDCNCSTKLVGIDSSLPFYIAPAALAKLAHKDGEAALARAAGRTGIIQALSNNSSISLEQVSESRVHKDQPLFFQLYVNQDMQKTRKLLKRVLKTGAYKALIITVDAPVSGFREMDERIKSNAALEVSSDKDASIGVNQGTTQSVAAALFSGTSPELVWKDLEWIKKEADNMPIIIKGIMTAEDAYMAYKYNCNGIILSNHGGRQLNCSPQSLLTLLEIRKVCPKIIGKIDIFLDGGIRRGTDIVK